ncbi:MBL fold metallo-hydrolase [Candidatus Dojkabacteria bacterium]|nr:MBL fold metallo-hydrolase [Candidatus Dojkabacteria bacterium]
MYKFKVLVEGYARAGQNGVYHASPTTSLIYDEQIKVLVDPGTNAEELKKAFVREGLKLEDIDIIFLSHYHPDHFLNIRLFPNVDIYDGGIRWHNDEEHFFEGKLPGTDIEIVATPGHATEQSSLVITTEELGVVFICQDVFWWEDGNQKNDTVEELMQNEDPFKASWEDLQRSRKTVLERADWIVPGHGKMFKNPTKR